MKNISAKIGEMEYDGLITGLSPSQMVVGGKIRKLGEERAYKRGTIFYMSTEDEKLVILGTSAALSEQKFSGDGATTAFTVTDKPAVLAGVKIGDSAASGYTYDASTGTLTFAVAPVLGTNNVVVSYAEEKLIPFGILCDDTVVGDEADEDASFYAAGCFDPDKCHAEAEYTITAEDYDEMRMRNIVFKAANK